MTLGFKVETSQADELIKRKRINNEEKLTEQLERLQMEVGTSKTLRISLEEQILTKEKIRKFTKQQLDEKDKKIMSLEKQLDGEKLAINQAEEKQKKIANQY
jgi:hypothetical protein